MLENSPYNKIKFEQTRSLSNAVCFKHDDNVPARPCACAVSTLILLPMVNISPQNGFSDIDFLYDVEILSVRRCFSLILPSFHYALEHTKTQLFTSLTVKLNIKADECVRPLTLSPPIPLRLYTLPY